jgi:hypothetical protein
MLAFACLSTFVLVGAAVEPPPKSEPKPASSVREFPAKDQPPQPLTVGDVIKGLGLDEAGVRYITEKPSGTLRMLSWRKVKLPGTEAEVDVEIQIGNPSLYHSQGNVFYELIGGDFPNGKWKRKRLQDITVLKVTISPSRRFD